MEFIRKYGVATHVYVPMIKRGLVDFAAGADWTPAAGDVKISRDGTAAANIASLPTALAMGNVALWDFSLSAAEMQSAKLMVTVGDSATKAVEDQAFAVVTFGPPSGELAGFDFTDGVRGGLTALPNANAAANGGLPTVDAGNAVKVQSGTGANQVNLSGGNVTAGAHAAGAINEAAFAADTAKYQAKLWYFDDDANATDRYVACWFKNGQPVTSGITAPSGQVIKAADGADLVPPADMTQVGSTGLYRLNEGSNRVVDGAAYVAKVTANIDGAVRTWFQPVGRDS